MSNTASQDPRPIGLFDSGIGGLTVLRTLATHLPNESFVYLGDTARLPYGTKSPRTIHRYLAQNIRFLTQQNVKAIVVACNTASTVLLNSPAETGTEGEFVKNLHLPIYNVIEPGAERANAASSTKRIGILATKATVAAASYVYALKDLDPQVEVYQMAAPLLVPLVEEGWDEDPLTNLVIYRYLQPLMQKNIDTLIMGCTHYPALRGGIGRVTGPNIALIDSSEAILEAIKRDIKNGRLQAGMQRRELRLLTTDASPGLFDLAQRLMRPHKIDKIELADIGTP